MSISRLVPSIFSSFSLLLALAARYAESRNDGILNTLSPIYARIVNLTRIGAKEEGSMFKPVTYYSINEDGSILFTYVLGLSLAVLSGYLAWYSLRKGYDAVQMFALTLSIGTLVVWDLLIGTLSAISLVFYLIIQKSASA